MKPPFGIAQVGKSFRNEITPGNFIFRTREFEQMEMEFFVKPGEDEEWHQHWIDARTQWYVDLGVKADNLRHYEHPKEKLSHYSKRTVDIEYRFKFAGSEWGELEGIANRTDFDLKTHAEASGQDLSYFDQAAGERYVPYVIEPAAGLSRSLMTFLVDAYSEDEAPNTKGGVDKRTVLRLDPRLAPIKVAVLPLSRNADLTPKAKDVAAELRRAWTVDFDDSGAIGRRYRRQDEIGTPYCVTVDFDTLDDHAVTVRERDSMQQERVGLDRLSSYFAERLRRLLRCGPPATMWRVTPARRFRPAPLPRLFGGALAVGLLAGCSGSDDGGADQDEPTAESSSTEDTSAEPTAGYLPVPEGVVLTEPGAEPQLRRPGHDRVASAAGHRGRAGPHRRADRQDDATRSRSRAGWSRKEMKGQVPYFVRVKATNVGEDAVGGLLVPLYGFPACGKHVRAPRLPRRALRAVPRRQPPGVAGAGQEDRSLLRLPAARGPGARRRGVRPGR